MADYDPASRLSISAARLDGLMARMQRALNVDGYEILTSAMRNWSNSMYPNSGGSSIWIEPWTSAVNAAEIIAALRDVSVAWISRGAASFRACDSQ
jgi:hypothetical protein